jgi:hypothetical protein
MCIPTLKYPAGMTGATSSRTAWGFPAQLRAVPRAGCYLVSVSDASPRPTSRGALVGALIAYFVIKAFVPFGSVLLYPLSLLSTWVHEMGHGIAALACGGSFASLDVFANGSGLAHTAATHPWQHGVVALAGLVAPPIAGSLLLATSRGPRRARALLLALAAAILVSLAVWVRSIAGWIALPLDAAAIAVFGVWGGPRERMIFAQLVGVALAADTWSGKDYLFTESAFIDGELRRSDIATVAASFGGPYLAWGLLVLVVSLALLAVGLAGAWRGTGTARPAPLGVKGRPTQ